VSLNNNLESEAEKEG